MCHFDIPSRLPACYEAPPTFWHITRAGGGKQGKRQRAVSLSPRNNMCSKKWARPGSPSGSDAAPTSTDIAAADLVALGSLMTNTYSQILSSFRVIGIIVMLSVSSSCCRYRHHVTVIVIVIAIMLSP